MSASPAPATGRRALDAALLALTLLALAPALPLVASRWNGAFEHGPLVLPLAAWLAARRRAALPPARAWAPGLVPVAVGGWLLVAGVDERVPGAAALGGVLAVAGVVAARGGPAVTRALALPLAFLLFLVPWPQVAFLGASGLLQLLAARLAAAAASAFVPVVREGVTLHLPSATLAVDAACAGLRGLIGVGALAVLLGGLEPDGRRRAALLALAAPAALLANVVRIVLLVGLIAAGVEGALAGPLHEATGLLVYLGAAGALVLAARLVPPRAAPPPLPAPPAPGATAPARGERLVRGALAALLVAVAAAGARAHAGRGPDAPAVGPTIPGTLGPASARWTGRDVPVPPRVREVLGSDDVLARRYAGPAGEVELYLVAAEGEPTRLFHAPEHCLRGEGYALEGPPVEDAGWRQVRLRRGAHVIHARYAVWVDGAPAPFTHELKVLAFLHRLGRGRRLRASFVRVAAEGPTGDAAVRAFAREALPEVLARLP